MSATSLGVRRLALARRSTTRISLPSPFIFTKGMIADADTGLIWRPTLQNTIPRPVDVVRFAPAVALATAAMPAAPVRAAQTDAPPAPKTPITVTEVAKGLENPWGLQFLPDGRMLVTERPGRMRIVGKDGKLSAPIKGLPEVVGGGQAGLLDVLLAPDFAQSGLIYFAYSEPRRALPTARPLRAPS